MNFHFLFSLLSTLSFVVNFPVHDGDRQDYFLFEGENQTAYLYRNNHSLCLHLSQGSNYSLYNTRLNKDNFTFSWYGFSVDGTEMILTDTVGSVDNFLFDSFTFISPIIEVIFNEAETSCIYQMNDGINYWYILLIVFAVSGIFESKTHGLRIAKKITAIMKFNGESLSEVMEIGTEKETAV